MQIYGEIPIQYRAVLSMTIPLLFTFLKRIPYFYMFYTYFTQVLFDINFMWSIIYPYVTVLSSTAFFQKSSPVFLVYILYIIIYIYIFDGIIVTLLFIQCYFYSCVYFAPGKHSIVCMLHLFIIPVVSIHVQLPILCSVFYVLYVDIYFRWILFSQAVY